MDRTPKYKPLTHFAFEVYVYGPMKEGKRVVFLDPKGDVKREIVREDCLEKGQTEKFQKGN